VELFDAIAKCFPAMRRHANYLFKQKTPEDRLKADWKTDVAVAMIEWIWDELLDEHTILYQTFLRAGFTNKFDMSYCAFEWYLCDYTLRHNKHHA